MANSSRSTQARTTFHVPIDITFDILSRLPVKSLLRFKSVCKIWYGLIESPNFIAKHLSTTHSTLNNPNSNASFNSLLVTPYNPEANSYGMSLHYFNKYGLFFDGPIDLDFHFFYGTNYPSVVGFCDGLVCFSLSEVGDGLVLCNPATRQFREIPDCELDYGLQIRTASFGFGFDPTAQDYKLIMIAYCENPNGEGVVRAHLYAVSTGAWREIDASKLSVFDRKVDNEDCEVVIDIVESSASAVVNGIFYWPAIDEEMVVVSFNMADEVFQKIRTPCLDGIWGETNWQIMQMKDKVALVIFDSHHDRGFDVWVLNDNERSWTNQVKAAYFPSIASPVEGGETNGDGVTIVAGCGRNDGELVVTEVEKSGDVKLFSYDPKSQEIRNLGFLWVPYGSSIRLYTETTSGQVKQRNWYSNLRSRVLNTKNKKRKHSVRGGD